jgi:hypothetical protein
MAKEKATRDDRKARRRERRAAAVPVAPARLDPAVVLGDIDAWNLREEAGWLRFDARLEAEARAYLRPAAGGEVIADAPGPLMAILGIGGARRAGFNAGPARFRYNVLAPADHIGAVGLEGTARAEPTPGLQHLRHRSREALLADMLLSWRFAARRGLPLYFVRAETDGSASISALGGGMAFANFIIALDNLCTAAETLGRPARVLAVGLDFGLEDVATTDAGAFAEGVRALMARITHEMRRRGLAPPVFLAVAEAGTARIADHPAIRAMWELAWCPGPHRLIIATPGYVAAQDRHGRPTEAGRQMLAELDAHALTAVEAGEYWLCPLPLLAEYQGAEIRVVFRALSGLVIDAADPFAAGPAAGFRITGTDRPVRIVSVTVAADDPRTLVLACDHAPTGAAPRLLHACALQAAGDACPINRSAVRDGWQADGAGQTLHRWAVPADLPLHPAPKVGGEAEG